MKLEISHRQPDSFLKREIVTVKGSLEGATPARAVLKKEIASKLNTKPELVQVRRIAQQFGAPSFTVEVMVYKDTQLLARLEPKKYKKNNSSEQKEKEEKKAPDKKKEVGAGEA